MTIEPVILSGNDLNEFMEKEYLKIFKKGKDLKTNTWVLSLFLRVTFWVTVLTLVMLAFYIYHEGAWKDVLRFYRFFYDPRRLRLFVESFGPFAALIFIAIQVLQVLFAPIPGEVTGIVGGFLFGNLLGFILSTIGLTIGSLLAFVITRKFGLRLVERVVKAEYIDKFNDFVAHKGLNITFIFFLIPGFPKDSLCYLLGLTQIKIADFIFLNVFGRLPGTLMLTLQGNALGNGRYAQFFWLLLLSIVLISLLYLTREYLIRIIGKVLFGFFGKKKDN